MAALWKQLIGRIHSASAPCVMAVTGGGAGAIAELLSVPGGSQSLLEAVVPYSEMALSDWLGRRPESFCSEETALAMAASAFQRAQRLLAKRDGSGRDSATTLIGVGCTASLVSDRPKKGEHRCHAATQTAHETASYSLVLNKGRRNRAHEERLVGQLVLAALARAAGIADVPALELVAPEAVVEHRARPHQLLVELMQGTLRLAWFIPAKCVSREGEPNTNEPQYARALERSPAGVLCGSFHPLHEGHRQLRNVAAEILQGPVAYEMSISNVDKPSLDFLSIGRRARQFTEQPLALTAAPTFAEKALLLPRTAFVVGVDTAERIIDVRYYGGSESSMEKALSTIRAQGCRFLVACRALPSGLVTLADLHLPARHADLFAPIPADLFRADISSTELRRAANE
jgi:hypothetical protein